MDQQMSRKHLQKLHFKAGNVTYSTGILKDYCTSLFQYKKLSTFFNMARKTLFLSKNLTIKQLTMVFTEYIKNVYIKIKFFIALNIRKLVALLIQSFN